MHVKSIKKQFPSMDQENNGHPLVYLDSTATAQKPIQVIEAITHYYENDNANVHRGVHTLGSRATTKYEDARETLRKLLNAHSSADIIYNRGTTAALHI